MVPILWQGSGCIGKAGRIAAVALLLLAGPGAAASAADARPPNGLERAYTAMVQDGYGASLCEKISPNATTRAAFNSSGTQIYHERSACYFYAAATELNDYYCPRVIEAGSWFLNGDYFSPESCRRFVARGQAWRATTGFDHEALLRAAGYTEADLRARIPDADPATAWLEFYLSFRRDSDGGLQRRLDRLPDFSSE